MEISDEDIQFLLDEYREAQQELLLKARVEDNYTQAKFYQGIKRGLETALIRLGMTNNQLDTICNEIYQKIIGHEEARE